MLTNKLSRDRETLALGRNKHVVERVVDEAEIYSWMAELLADANIVRPTHVGLVRFAQQFNLELQYNDAIPVSALSGSGWSFYQVPPVQVWQRSILQQHLPG
jgi:hypothetical protein